MLWYVSKYCAVCSGGLVGFVLFALVGQYVSFCVLWQKYTELSQHPAASMMRVNGEVDRTLGNDGTSLNCALRHSSIDSNIQSKWSFEHTI